MSQTELIQLHGRFAADAGTADEYRRGHYEHLLASLARLIEFHGPTAEYHGFARAAESAPPA